uniref:Uncharacterized protein n=1 Tax=Acrobeloides nanus TaxID=290746 RepID=A0A914CTA4_9BILA
MGKLDGKVAIVTGSSCGIGQATAVLFAEEGASVIVHGRSSESLQKTHNLLKSKGIPESRILIVQGVIEDDKTCDDLINKTVQKFGKLDVLVNNAGICGKHGIDQNSMENFKYVFDVNLRSVVYLTQLAIPHLEKTNGNIVNVSSGGSIRANPDAAFYCMTKAAMDHMTRCYSLLLADKGIRINTLNPGFTATEFGVKMGMTLETYKEFRDAVTSAIVPMKRDGSSEEMATSILFLATDATYMTGANIFADGGYVNFSPTPKLQ